VRTLNSFWRWAVAKGLDHPAFIARIDVKKYVGRQRNTELTAGRLRVYFAWLRRDRAIVNPPTPEPLPRHKRAVRVCGLPEFTALTKALPTKAVSAEVALMLYLIMFQGFRNIEVAHARAVGFRGGQFRVRVDAPTGYASSVRGRARFELDLPTDRLPWLRTIVTGVLDSRARRLKLPENAYLFVSGSWRCGTAPIHPTLVGEIVLDATMNVCGHAMTPTLLRVTGGTLVADRGDHTTCAHLGWSMGRALDLAYGVREVDAANATGELQKRNLKRTSYSFRHGIPRR